MTRKRFAQALGFISYKKLVSASEVIVTEGDVYWYVTPLADGRWAAWDDAELDLDRVSYFTSREEAEAFHKDAYAEKYLEKFWRE